MSNADALSRLPLPDQPTDSEIPSLGDINQVTSYLAENLVTASQIRAWTEKDPVLSRLPSPSLHSSWLA